MSLKIAKLHRGGANDASSNLREMAKDFDADPSPRRAVVVLIVEDEDRPPQLCQFGRELSAITLAGALSAGLRIALDPE